MKPDYYYTLFSEYGSLHSEDFVNTTIAHHALFSGCVDNWESYLRDNPNDLRARYVVALMNKKTPTVDFHQASHFSM